MKYAIFTFLILMSGNLFGQVNCGGVAITGFTIFNCGVGQSPQLQISVSVCSNQAQAGNWTISYPGGTNTVSFYVQNSCPSPFNCGTPGPSTINLPQNFNCSTVNVNNIVITNASGQSPCAFQRVSSCSALPLDIISFKVFQEASFNKLEWVTTNEVNVNRIIVENSSDGVNFKEITSLNSQEENSIDIKKYSFLHLFTTKVNYYRLKIVDHDLSYKYSDIVNIENKFGSELIVFPNPAKNTIYLKSPFGDEINKVNIYDFNKRLRLSSEQSSLDVSSLEPGIYIIEMKKNDVVHLGKFVVN